MISDKFKIFMKKICWKILEDFGQNGSYIEDGMDHFVIVEESVLAPLWSGMTKTTFSLHPGHIEFRFGLVPTSGGHSREKD